MAKLIDEFIKNIKDNTVCIDNMWVIARPMTRSRYLKNRIKDAILVLFDKAEAIKYYKQ